MRVRTTSRWGGWLWAWVCLLGACGGSGDAGTGGAGGSGGAGGGYGPCEERPSSGPVSEVDIRVASPLPSELVTGCDGDPQELEAVLFLDDRTCVVDAGPDGAEGCCPQVPAQSYSGALVYRVARTGFSPPVAEQVRLVEVPGTGGPVQDLSFAGRPLAPSYADNRAQWCAGEL